jgi:acyl-CoA synthetase (AMP-forming)/AMP-acid ligase II
VILRPGAALDCAQLVAWSRLNMANYKVPRYLLAFDAFPLNASGKVLKRDLASIARQRLAEGAR